MNMSHSMILWLLFTLGAILHVVKRAGYAMRSGKFPSRRSFFYMYWDNLLVRNAMGAVLFWTWSSQPQLLASLLAKVGMTMPLNLPITTGTAFLAGYFIDSVLDWLLTKIPWLKREIPTLPSENGTTTILSPAVLQPVVLLPLEQPAAEVPPPVLPPPEIPPPAV